MRGFKHFFSSLPIQTPQLTIRGVGVQERMPPSIIDRPQGTGDHLFMLFYEPVWISAHGETTLQPPGTLMLWTPGRHQYYGNPDRPYRHTWIHCNGTRIRSLLRSNRLPCNSPLLLGDASLMERHFLDIHAELTRHGRPDRIMVSNLIENWLRNTARATLARDPSSAIPESLLASRHFIESEHTRPLALPELAARAKLSLSHYCAQFKQHFGMAPIEYLIQHRMHQAAHLLRDRRVTISEAGQRVGYDDLYHFSKLFKKHFGASPRHWRDRTLAVSSGAFQR